MIDVLDQGRRPRLKNALGEASRTADALKVCPGVGLEHPREKRAPEVIRELLPTWGPVLEVWEGHAVDPEIRWASSSGGAASALALFCIERADMHGVLHVAARPDVPYLNRTVLSTSREEILAATGSRYAPASPCDELHLVEEAPRPCVFIGKPCDVAATVKARAIRPKLDEKLGLTIAFFCAGTPSTRGTLEMIRRMGIDDPESVVSVRYRGMGWPGKAAVRFRTEAGEETRELTYDQSWGGVLEKHRQWRCYVCADHTGEFADVSVGDPWYRKIRAGEPGRSLVLVRSERGRRAVAAARDAGYLRLDRADPAILPASQRELARTRGAVWGRTLTCRLFGAAAPRFDRFPLFWTWWTQLSLKEKAQSFYGTAKRVFTKKLRQRLTCEPYVPPRARETTAVTP
ncbi:MAG: Coenzyme F420 hydrogenase/dehydrogenase, beta subunit C-terminal domain [Planctomycetes bacterium]|nr:Coenzyme F420 hydrogenase/dehydrogenase, beta subunit C-terminal domain [Planctomycetota bacterium]MBI3843451.1 Coenzyme F420 hydrogenase/dehydrogenase, beta subunit C-terminal domain [Planctomycetota bacterium]